MFSYLFLSKGFNFIQSTYSYTCVYGAFGFEVVLAHNLAILRNMHKKEWTIHTQIYIHIIALTIIRHKFNKSTLPPKESLEFNDQISTNGFQVKTITKNMSANHAVG
jgi:hypothetical protein